MSPRRACVAYRLAWIQKGAASSTTQSGEVSDRWRCLLGGRTSPRRSSPRFHERQLRGRGFFFCVSSARAGRERGSPTHQHDAFFFSFIFFQTRLICSPLFFLHPHPTPPPRTPPPSAATAFVASPTTRYMPSRRPTSAHSLRCEARRSCPSPAPQRSSPIFFLFFCNRV